MTYHASQGSGLAVADSSIIKQLRSSFESQLKTAKGAAIETWLSKSSDDDRPAVFAELLEAELAYCQERGQVPSLNEYLARFSGFDREIYQVFNAHVLKSPRGSNDQSIDSTIDAVPSPIRHSEIRHSEEWPSWKTGDFVGRYRLDVAIGHGASGDVWKGFDPELNRAVAIKLPRKKTRSGFDVMLQFRDEARRASSLNYEGIVPVYDIGQVGNSVFIVSEFIDGPTLSERIKAGPISREESVRIVAHLARSLHQAHRAGLVHRDIKPSNVLMRPDGSPAITDFGLAISEQEQLTAGDGVVGTAAFMSPEQARGEGRLVDGRSDLYGLGVILFQLLTGRLPFQYKTSSDLLDQIIHREVRPLRSIDDTIPPALERICLRCLAKGVRDRYSTGRDLADDLQNWNTAPKRMSRSVMAAIALLVSAVLLGTAQFGFTVKPKDATTPIVPSVPEAGSLARTDKWLELLDQPLEKVAYLKAGPSTGFLLDTSKRTLSVQSGKGFLTVLATPHKGRPPFRIRSSISMDEWIGTAGFVWGITDDLAALPKKQRYCFVLIIQRMDPNLPAYLILHRLTVGEMFLDLFDVQWVNTTNELARKPIEMPKTQSITLEFEIQDTEIEVFWDGLSVWKPTFRDPKRREAILASDGLLGFAAHGKSVVFRDATVKFLSSTRKNN